MLGSVEPLGGTRRMGVGGVRQDFEFQSWLLLLGVRYLTGGSNVGYILPAAPT
ncbi:MAG TPA: hypothetical protein VK797_18305 [Tepidisphaeraceae bacterium]|nr:hypothetical protein [Tepidisphaeraceae bacterium]